MLISNIMCLFGTKQTKQPDMYNVVFWYDLRYDTVDWCALKSWLDGQLNLAHGPETNGSCFVACGLVINWLEQQN